jgi:hypothetical protein
MQVRAKWGQVLPKWGKAKTKEVAVTPPDRKDDETSHIVLTALAFKKAVDELVRFAHAAKSLGLASWGSGIVFAGVAVGLHFWKVTDMAEPEFVSCMVFSSVLVLGGFCLYILESRGYVKLVSEFAVKKPDAADAPAATISSSASGPGPEELPAIAGATEHVATANGSPDMTGPEAAPVAAATSP